ncbi:Rsp5p-dependent ubiquitination, sorting of cargo proteins at the multivesicular body [Myotisia sp. PD_48]|nr:Rsp5p-dependent ubiquitination, sorting of cargo proteins at the multivesicular body [Myotisia sp. PD_48]
MQHRDHTRIPRIPSGFRTIIVIPTAASPTTSTSTSTPTPTTPASSHDPVSLKLPLRQQPPTAQFEILNDARPPRSGVSQMIIGDRSTVAAYRGSHGSTGKGILIGILSAFGSAGVAIIILSLFFFFRYTQRGRIILDRLGRPGEYDDEQEFAREEEEALESMDELQRAEYFRAKAFIQANPPETMQTDISLSQFLAIQEKGVSAWEFEPELEIANCFVEARTEIEFFDSECGVQSNLPVPKQNEVYYWEAKIYDKPDSSLISIGMTTKPYPLFRLPGYHKSSVAYQSTGHRRHNQAFTPTPYGPEYVQGDVIGVGYRPRTGTIFFTRNGKKLDDVAHGLKSQNFFPTVGANGPCTVHVNFGQMGFVYIEANVKKWGLAPMTGSLAPPPPYGSEQGSILLETGRDGSGGGGGGGGQAQLQWWHPDLHQHTRTRSNGSRVAVPSGPVRTPTDISLGPLPHVPSQEDAGEGPSRATNARDDGDHSTTRVMHSPQHQAHSIPPIPPPEYSSPERSPTPRSFGEYTSSEGENDSDINDPPIPTYAAAVRGTDRAHS